ncbi:hypothetical protein V8E53_008208 [Lactarius tabidus]
MKFGKGKGKAKDKRRDGYSHILDLDESGSFPHESHELVAQDATASGAQPGPSGQSKSRKLQEAEKLREQAHKKEEKGNEFEEQAQKARKSGSRAKLKRLMKLATNCWDAMKRLHQKASDLFYKVYNNWNAKPGEVNLQGQYPHEAIEIAKKRIPKATSKGEQTMRFITDQGRYSKNGPEVLLALQEYMTERGLESKVDPDNGDVLNVQLPRQES